MNTTYNVVAAGAIAITGAVVSPSTSKITLPRIVIGVGVGAFLLSLMPDELAQPFSLTLLFAALFTWWIPISNALSGNGTKAQSKSPAGKNSGKVLV